MKQQQNTSAMIRVITYSCIAIILIIILTLGLFGRIPFIPGINWNFGGNYYANSEQYQAGGDELTVTDMTQLEVNWMDGIITILPYDGTTVQFFETNAQNLAPKDQLHYLYQDGKLTIQYKSAKHFPFLFGSINGKGKSLEIKLPKSIAENLNECRVDSVSSKIDISGIQAEKISLDTTSGDLKLRESTTDTLSIDSVSGSIQGEQVVIDEKMDVDTTSGKITLSGSIQEIEFNSISGELNLTSQVCPGKITTDTVSGKVTVSIPENDGFCYYKDTLSGKLQCDFSVTQEEDKGIYKNGNAEFSFDSLSGDITIKKIE